YSSRNLYFGLPLVFRSQASVGSGRISEHTRHLIMRYLPRLIGGPSKACEKRRALWHSLIEREIHFYLSDNFHCLAIQHRGTIDPLLHRVGRGLHKCGVAAQELDVLELAILADGRGESD